MSERDRQTDRQTDRWRQRERVRDKDKDMDRDTDRQTETEPKRQREMFVTILQLTIRRVSYREKRSTGACTKRIERTNQKGPPEIESECKGEDCRKLPRIFQEQIISGCRNCPSNFTVHEKEQRSFGIAFTSVAQGNKLRERMCVCACVSACMCACVRACVCVFYFFGGRGEGFYMFVVVVFLFVCLLLLFPFWFLLPSFP